MVIFVTVLSPYAEEWNKRGFRIAFPNSRSGLIPSESTWWGRVVFNRGRV